MEGCAADVQPHAVLVPGPGLGHVNGMVLLAKALLSAGFRVTVAFFQHAFQAHASNGRLLHLPHLPAARTEVLPDGLPPPPPHASSFVDLFRVTPAMRHSLLQLLSSLSSQQQPATCLICDTTMTWTQDVADEVGIPRVEFWTSCATVYLTILALPQLIAQGHVGSHTGEVQKNWKSERTVLLDCIPGYESFPLDEVPIDFRSATLENPLLQRFLEVSQYAKRAHCLLIHSVDELEHKAFQALQHAAHISTYAVGPLIDKSNNYTSSNPILAWLDAHEPSSVIYVSFGSTIVHTKDEIEELAHGLEASGKPFVWVIPSHSLMHGQAISDILPKGFLTQVGDRGLIVPWVSQLDILAHPSVGGFLTHCGWNSTLESLWMGVPLLCCPKRADQPINSKLLKKLLVGIELQTSIEEIHPSRHDIEVGIKELFEGELGCQARTRARDIKCVLRKASAPGGQSFENLHHFASRMKEIHLQK